MNKMFKFTIVLFSLCAKLTFGATKINVGAYEFPPFFYISNGQHQGLVGDLIKEINSFQTDYEFTLVKTSSSKRYEDFSNQKFDLMFFEDKVSFRPTRSAFFFFAMRGGGVQIFSNPWTFNFLPEKNSMML